MQQEVEVQVEGNFYIYTFILVNVTLKYNWPAQLSCKKIEGKEKKII